MNKIIGIFMLLGSFCAAAGGIELEPAEIDLNNKASLKRGGQLFITYCQGCHSAKHMRYSRIASDLGLDQAEVSKDLIIGAKTINGSMTTAMDANLARDWFLGVGPPDLSLIARSRGGDWLYGYLRGFYVDESRPFGVNNSVYPDVAMPHVLWEVQGLQKAIFKTVDGKQVLDRFEIIEKGDMSATEFDQAMTDLVNFLVYVGEPAKLERTRLGKYVVFYLLIFLVLAFLLKKEYWKDLH
jgi:ubiquinol-cytochrome c reductase cytochrome c1 subunit